MQNWTLEEISVGVLFIVGLISGVSYLLKPVKEYNQKQRENDAKFKELDKHLDNDNKRLNRLEEDTKQILLSVNVLLQHSSDNNHTGELAKRQKELSDYLIQR